MQEGTEARDYTRAEFLHAWAGVGLAPLVTAAAFQLKYMLVPFACQSRSTLVLHLVSLGALIVALYGLYAAHQTWLLGGRGWPGEQHGRDTRNQFLGILGMSFTALMILLILAQWAPIFYLDPCTHG